MTFSSEVDLNSAGSVSSQAISKSVTSGNHLVIAIALRNGATVSSVTDDQGQTWNSAVAHTAGARSVAIYHCANAYTGTLAVTVTPSVSETLFLLLMEATKSAPVTVNETDTHSVTASTSHPCGATGVDAISGDFIVTVSTQSSSVSDETVASGFTVGSFAGGSNGRQYWQRQVASGTLTNDTATFTAVTSHDSTSCMAVFRDAASGGATRAAVAYSLWLP